MTRYKKFKAENCYHYHISLYDSGKLLMILLIGFVGLVWIVCQNFLLVFAHSSEAVIENNVSSSATSSRNVIEGEGEIRTGNASATSLSSTIVNGEGKAKIDVKAEATADGKKETKEVHRETEGNVNEEVKVDVDANTNSSNNAFVSVEATAGDTSLADNPTDKDGVGEGNSIQSSENTNQENKSFFGSVAENISNAIKRFFDKLISFVS